MIHPFFLAVPLPPTLNGGPRQPPQCGEHLCKAGGRDQPNLRTARVYAKAESGAERRQPETGLGSGVYPRRPPAVYSGIYFRAEPIRV